MPNPTNNQLLVARRSQQQQEEQQQEGASSTTPHPKRNKKKKQKKNHKSKHDSHDASPHSSVQATVLTSTSTAAASMVKKNPLLDHQTKFLDSLPKKLVQNFFSNSHTNHEIRAETWSRQADIGERLVNQYAWATPDERCMKILKFFSEQNNGIVEMGCGSNAYWARMMKDHGVNVMAFDAFLGKGGKISEIETRTKGDESPSQTARGKKRKRFKGEKDPWSSNVKTFPDGFKIYKGGPEVLKRKDLQKRGVLFLCYPDEDILMPETTGMEHYNDDGQSLGATCLEYFKGDIVIHVGEIFGDTPSMDQAPWGRSSGSVFQQRLASEFHCILKAGLKNWLHVNDTISVWKRTELCSIVFQGEDDEDEESEDEEVEYRHIPMDERLPMDVAAPCVQHLLAGENNDKTE